MDVGRDLIDHRIVDRDGHDVGRVDDVWVRGEIDRAVIGPIVTGTGALLRQFGRMGDWLTWLALHGYPHAARWREFGWHDIDQLQRPQLVLAPRHRDLAAWSGRRKPRHGSEWLYTDLIRLPVRDPGGRRLGVVDVRTTLPEPIPRVVGFLVAPHPLRRTLGLKRFDSTGERFAGVRHDTQFLAWTEVTGIHDGAIRCGVPLASLPLLSATAQSAAPPMPTRPDPP
jgi:hypothetical protein